MHSKEVYIDKSNIDSYVTKYNNVTVYPKSVCEDHCVEVKAETLGECNNLPAALNPLTAGVVAKLPVVLAELTVQFNVMSKIDLPEAAIEIKNIKKKVKLTQCMLLQDTNVLFIKGFVRKNIDYSTRNCSNYQGICGDIRHCTVDIPFECTTAVIFNGTTPAPPVINTSTEFEYFSTKDLSNAFAEKDHLLSGDLSEYNQISTEFFNDLPFCKLISSRIVEFDEYLHRDRPRHVDLPVGEKLFTKIEEKMVIILRLQLLQERPVAIGPTAVAPHC